MPRDIGVFKENEWFISKILLTKVNLWLSRIHCGLVKNLINM